MALSKRDAIEQANDALGHGSHIVKRIRLEFDSAERAAPDFIGAGEIAFENDPSFS